MAACRFHGQVGFERCLVLVRDWCCLVVLTRHLRMLLIVVVGSLLDNLVVFGALYHADLAEVGQEIRPHHVVLEKQTE